MALQSRLQVWLTAAALALVAPNLALAFLNNGRWTTTAFDGPTDPIGRPITLTWSIVPDGTMLSFVGKPSNLVSFFDGIYVGGSGKPLVEKPWFPIVQSCFNRWGEVSGITYVYEPADDGQTHGTLSGVLGLRGDIRLGGAEIAVGGSLAEAGFIPFADITIDTIELNYYQNLGGAFPNINLRTTLMHEIGHTLGLGHASSNNANFLMEGFSQTNFDGPQIDDIRGAHFLYGDHYEKTNGGLGNETFANATPLGTIRVGQGMLLGDQGGTGTVVLSTETDFVSIANSSDVDVFSFSIDRPSIVDIVLTPIGATYHERGTVNTSTVSNLSLELYMANGGTPLLLQSANFSDVGLAESLLDFELRSAGTYFARITGSADDVQLYQLMLSVDEQFLLGDFNDDGRVDSADFTLWRDHLGDVDESAILNRGDGLAGIGLGDLSVWKSHFGDALVQGGSSAQNVPEPGALTTVFSLLLGLRLIAERSARRSRQGGD